jgi:FlaA1/EpsC-like NDP-sugar epimerase
MRPLLLLLLDGVVAAGALYAVLFLRFEGEIPAWCHFAYPSLALAVAISRSMSSALLRLHRWSFRLSGLADGMRVAVAGLLGSGIFAALILLLRIPAPPRSIFAFEFLLSTVVIGAVRYSPRVALTYMADRSQVRKSEARRTLIVGDGTAGDSLLRDLRGSRTHDYLVVGFVDNDPVKQQMIVGGKPVLGALDEIGDLVREHDVHQILVAMPTLEAPRLRQLLSQCANLRVAIKVLPLSFDYLAERASASMLQELTPEDLLPRPAVALSDADERGRIAGRVALVTGAAGSIGSEICRQLLLGGARQLVLVDMNENELYLMQRRLAPEHPASDLRAEVADIRDPERLRRLFRKYRPHDVFHAAAHKHVPLMETAPGEAVKNNILGTRNVAEAADEFSSDRFIYISTDKAVRPTSVMGATKRVGEQVVRRLNISSRTEFCAVRFGNVLGSAGSVVPLFREQISRGGPVTVTHEDVRRYFMTIGEAVGLVLRAAYGNYGELCVLDMGEQLRIVDLARHMITMVGKVPELEIPIVFTGLRPGEKLHEELMTEEEEAVRPVNEKIFVVDGPAPSGALPADVEELAAAASCGDDERVLEVLRRVVPTFDPTAVMPAARFGLEREAASSASQRRDA